MYKQQITTYTCNVLHTRMSNKKNKTTTTTTTTTRETIAALAEDFK